MPDIWGLAAIAAKFAIYLGVLTSAGTVFVALLFRVTDVGRFAIVFAGLGLFGTIIGFSLAGAVLTGDVSGMTDRQMLGLLWTTSAGTAIAYRLVGLSLLIFGMMIGRPGLWMSALGGMIALWSFATVGHIPDRALPWLDALLLLHLITVAVWIGILTPLKRLAHAASADLAADLGERFGRLAIFTVPLLILAGLVMSYVLVGSIAALFETGYGQFLMGKIAVVAILLGLAALNKVRFVPRLTAGDISAAQHLSRSIAWEWSAVIAILLVTAILTSALTLPS